MSKVKIYIQTNDYEVTNDIFRLLKEATGDSYDINLISCDDEFKKPPFRPYHSVCFFNCGTFYFHYDIPPTISRVEEYDKLEEFAQGFKNTVVDIIKNSKHRDRLDESAIFKLNRDVLENLGKQYRKELVKNEPFSVIANYSSNKSSTSNFFPTNPQFSNRFKIELAGGIVLGLISLPLFFFEPYTATLLAFCAIILLCAAYDQYKQDNKDNLAFGV